MKRSLLKQAVLGAALALSAGALWAAADIGQPAPEFKVQDAQGKTVDLAAYRGKTVVLEWTNHQCPFVQKHYESGNIPTLHQQAAKAGVVWLQVISSAPGQQGNVDGATALQLNKDRKAAPAKVLLDTTGEVGKLYGAQTTPHIFIVDKKGTLVYKGGIDSIASTDKEDIAKAQNYVSTSLQELASGQKISNPTTRPYGCSVKYPT